LDSDRLTNTGCYFVCVWNLTWFVINLVKKKLIGSIITLTIIAHIIIHLTLSWIFIMPDKSDMIHTKECTYRNNHDFRHDNCFCTCHPKNEKKKGNLKPEMRKNME